MGLWSDSGIPIPGNGFKFESDGDTVAGIIVKSKPFSIEAKDDKAGLETLEITLRQGNGDEIEVPLMGIDLRIKFAKVDPDLNDWIKIKRVGKAGNKVLFDIDHRQNPAKAGPSADSDIPF
jgi:hypothetical protein